MVEKWALASHGLGMTYRLHRGPSASLICVLDQTCGADLA